jgi:UDPglucose 6-dehydrogenase
VSNPEFLKQGAAIDDFMKPDRVVIGAEDPRAAELMKELYAPFTRTGAPIMLMDCASAELCKYAANAMLATRISFMNEVANVCEAVGADVDTGAAGDGGRQADRPVVPLSRGRLRRQLLPEGRQGAAALLGREALRLPGFCEAVEAVNERQKVRLLDKLKAHFGSLEGQAHRASGGSRSSRAPTTCARRRRCPLVKGLLAAGPRPGLRSRGDEDRPRRSSARITYAENSYAALTGADALLIVTEWNEFREPDFARMRKLMRTPVIFDGRNIYNPEQMRAQGFTYTSMGRP